ncbi:hypothetical protein BD309DRAFT_112404 [Dichomitus squalens]|nr:hypothetical protein BD309DRAFT_112404 [Dichomitus squalens]
MFVAPSCMLRSSSVPDGRRTPFSPKRPAGIRLQTWEDDGNSGTREKQERTQRATYQIRQPGTTDVPGAKSAKWPRALSASPPTSSTASSMPLRPPSSAGRPSSARPTTGRPATAAYFDGEPQYTYDYSIDEDDEEDDDESDAGDVFAFGPPPTAASPITPPPPTFDPTNIDRVGPVPGPSQTQPYHRQPYPLSPVESPPSTDSQNQHGSEDAYRLRRLPPTSPTSPSTPTTGTGRFTGVSSAISSREVHVSLPKGGSTGGKGKERPPSTTRSASFPSVADSASIK